MTRPFKLRIKLRKIQVLYKFLDEKKQIWFSGIIDLIILTIANPGFCKNLYVILSSFVDGVSISFS